MQNSCNTFYPRNMACFRYVIVYTVHKGDNGNDDDYDDDDDDGDGDNNNDLLTVMKLGHFLTRSAVTHSEVSVMVFPGTPCHINVQLSHSRPHIIST